ncbi:hypothetical protein EHP00_1484 [Ecytonucleospora hepatopenaei]|uniref:Uncharacterized protein n=1 Tax=Ecytonucleospora hepatopenaei TaxID=646526 RepID=A0A1W0E8S2_9MICR|nr:hypothetical protein EHP00_1484 [Ecytonucleospora hepatopenaei]
MFILNTLNLFSKVKTANDVVNNKETISLPKNTKINVNMSYNHVSNRLWPKALLGYCFELYDTNDKLMNVFTTNCNGSFIVGKDQIIIKDDKHYKLTEDLKVNIETANLQLNDKSNPWKFARILFNEIKLNAPISNSKFLHQLELLFFDTADNKVKINKNHITFDKDDMTKFEVVRFDPNSKAATIFKIDLDKTSIEYENEFNMMPKNYYVINYDMIQKINTDEEIHKINKHEETITLTLTDDRTVAIAGNAATMELQPSPDTQLKTDAAESTMLKDTEKQDGLQTKESTSTEKKKMGTGMKVFVGICVVLLLFGALAIGFVLYKKRQTKKHQEIYSPVP